MYLLLTGECPEDGLVRLPLKAGRLRHAKGAVNASVKGGECVVTVAPYMYSPKSDIHVITLTFDRPAASLVAQKVIPQGETLSWSNALPGYSYSCFDYYSNYRSTVAYNWSVAGRSKVKGLELKYAMSDAGKDVKVQVGDKEYEVALGFGNEQPLKNDVDIVSCSFGRMRGGTFDRNTSLSGVQWTELETPQMQCDVRPFSNYLMKVVLKASETCRVHLDVITGNGMELLVRDNKTGEYVPMMKHLNPYRATAFAEII